MEQANESHETHRGHLENMGVLNLLAAKTPEDLSGITSIENIGCVLIPEPLSAALMAIPIENVGAVVPIPVDGKVNVVAGQGRFTGEALAQGGSETLLVIAGQLFITTVVEKVGYRGIHVAGQVLAPIGSEAGLSPAITSLMGQVFYYKAGARTFMGHDRLGREFFEFVDSPIAMMITGHLEIEDDVTMELLKAKVSEIALCGHLEVPRHLLALTQFLTVEKTGHISARD